MTKKRKLCQHCQCLDLENARLERALSKAIQRDERAHEAINEHLAMAMQENRYLRADLLKKREDALLGAVKRLAFDLDLDHWVWEAIEKAGDIESKLDAALVAIAQTMRGESPHAPG